MSIESLKVYVTGVSENKFVQRIVLSGVCQQLHWLVATAGDQFTALKDELDHLTADESGEVNKTRTASLKQRIGNVLDQEDDATIGLENASSLYKELFNETWKPAVKGQSKEHKEEAVDARIADRLARRA